MKNKQGIRVPALLGSIMAAWLIAAAIEYVLLPGELRDLASLEGLKEMSFLRVLAIVIIGTFLLFIFKSKSFRRWGMTAAFGVLACVALIHSFTWTFLAGCIAITVVIVVYGFWGWDSSPEPERKAEPASPVCIWLTAVFCLVFFLLVSAWTVGRVRSFSAPTYDFGIFSQMFYSMKTTGLPMTTLERDGLLSHFCVHISPIYYLMFPFYCLVPKPETLQVLQAAVITSAVIPLWKIGKHHGLTGAQRMLLCILLLLFPAFSGGTGYDLHENCFLAPLLLWLFYGLDRKNTLITAISALLTLTVKEDAPVYVAVIALWLIVKTLLRYRKGSARELLAGGVLLAASVFYFVLATGFLAGKGDGVMTGRYDNFMFDGTSSLITVIKSVVLSPIKTLYECCDPEKLYYIAMTMLPFMGLPLITRRYERYILLIPYILINLMSDYQYQHDIFFQYSFGSTACLVYLTAVNLSDLKWNSARAMALIAAAAVSATCFCSVILPRALQYPVQCVKNGEQYGSIREALAVIPNDAVVTASTFYTVELSNRTYLYDVCYAEKEHLLSSQYVALAVNGNYDRYEAGEKGSGIKRLTDMLKENGYVIVSEIPGVLVIYQKGI